ncbi:MAG: hypothetical protein WCY25_10400 [Moheibacter sp.]
MKNLLHLVFILLVSMGFAQEKLVKGRIIIDLEDASPEGIYITNARTNLTSITDLTGSFAIHAMAGDSLLIRSTFYESRRFYLTEFLLGKELLSIHLNMQPIVLEEALIAPKLTGILEKDAKYVHRHDPVAELYTEMGINPDVKPRRDATDFAMWKDISPLHLNVEKLSDVISGDLRRRQNLFNYEDKEAILTEIREYFGDDYFTQDLDIPHEKIREFIFFAYETTFIAEHHKVHNYFKIMEELIKAKPIYINRLQSQPKTD